MQAVAPFVLDPGLATAGLQAPGRSRREGLSMTEEDLAVVCRDYEIW